VYGKPSLVDELKDITRRLGALERSPKLGTRTELLPASVVYPGTMRSALGGGGEADLYDVGMVGNNNAVVVMDIRVFVYAKTFTLTPVTERGTRGPSLVATKAMMKDHQIGDAVFPWRTFRWLWAWPGGWNWEEGDGSSSFRVVGANENEAAAAAGLYEPLVTTLPGDAAERLGVINGTPFPID
jgi:hypothetical protein